MNYLLFDLLSPNLAKHTQKLIVAHTHKHITSHSQTTAHTKITEIKSHTNTLIFLVAFFFLFHFANDNNYYYLYGVWSIFCFAKQWIREIYTCACIFYAWCWHSILLQIFRAMIVLLNTNYEWKPIFLSHFGLFISSSVQFSLRPSLFLFLHFMPPCAVLSK